MENYTYAVIYDLLKGPVHDATKMIALKELKAKIIRLNSTHRQRIMVYTTEKDMSAGEDPSIIILSKNAHGKVAER